MYIVISHPNNRDTSACVIAPRYIGDDAKRALVEARLVWTQKDVVFVSSVVIYKLVPETTYLLKDSLGREDDPSKTIRCVMWMNDDGLVEKFYQDFKEVSNI